MELSYDTLDAALSRKPRKTAASRFGDAILGAFRWMMEASPGNQCLKHYQYLDAKSDEELAEMGLRREELAQHVFADRYTG